MSNHDFFFFSWNSLFDYLIWVFFFSLCLLTFNKYTHTHTDPDRLPFIQRKLSNGQNIVTISKSSGLKISLSVGVHACVSVWRRVGGGGEGISGVTMCVWQECFCGWFLLLFPPVSSGVDRTGGSSERTAASDKTLGEDDVCHLGIECVCVFAWAGFKTAKNTI